MAARASRTRSVVGALALAALLASCATGAEVEDETVGANPAPSPTASPEPTPEPTAFTTQNGTASFAVPAGWTVEDTSELDPVSNHGGPVWLNSVALVDAEGTPRAHYSDGYADDVGAAVERLVVQSLPMGDGLHAAGWWSTAGEGDVWHVEAAVVADLDAPSRTVVPEGFDRLHAFTADLEVVPECASVIDEASATACLEAPGATEALELLATLELEALPWDAMPEGVDPVADMPWVEWVSADGALAFSHPEGWTVDVMSSPDGPFVVLSTPDGYQALDVSTYRERPEFPFASACAPGVTPLGPWTVIERTSVEPLAGTLAGTASSTLEVVTFEAYDLVIVALLTTADVDAGCLDTALLVDGGMVRATTPFQTDAPNLIYDRYADRRLPVGSYEHEVIVEVLGSLRISSLGTA